MMKIASSVFALLFHSNSSQSVAGFNTAIRFTKERRAKCTLAPNAGVGLRRESYLLSSHNDLSIGRTMLASSSTSISDDVKSSPSETASIIPDMKAYSRGYCTVMNEISCQTSTSSTTTGVIPKDLVGTYYRCGPAMFTAGSIPPPINSAVKPKNPPVSDGTELSRMVIHPFEGDGGVFAATFHGDKNQTKATFRFRFVRTAGFQRERKKGEKQYSAMESTRSLLGPCSANDFPLPLFRHHLQPGLNKKRKNTSNTRALYWGRRLLTTWEGGLPYKIDALALSTEGPSQLGGVLPTDAALGQRGNIDSANKRLVMYSLDSGGKSSDLTLFEFNDRFSLVGGKRDWKLPGYAILNDFGLTESYAVFVQPPVQLNGLQFMMSKDPGQTLKIEESGNSIIHLIPREGSAKQQMSFKFPSDGHGVLANIQFINSYEEGNGDVVVFDVVRSNGPRGGVSADDSSSSAASSHWPWSSSLKDYARRSSFKSLWRIRLNTKSGTVSTDCLCDLQASFGIVNQAFSAEKHKYIFASVGGMGRTVAPPQGILKFNCDLKSKDQIWMPEPHEFCGEPAYASRAGSDPRSVAEDDGYILSILFNGKSRESELIVFEAQNITVGPIARISMGVGIPHGLHGCFSEESDWSEEELLRRAKLADKMEGKGNRWNEVKSDFSGLGLRLDDFDEYFGELL